MSTDRESVARRWEREDLIERSSVGAALKDIEERGIEAHIRDLERELHPKWRKG